MERTRVAAMMGGSALDLGGVDRVNVIEIGLLISSDRVTALIALSKRNQRSVAQMLRGWIDDAIDAECQSEGLMVPTESSVQ